MANLCDEFGLPNPQMIFFGLGANGRWNTGFATLDVFASKLINQVRSSGPFRSEARLGSVEDERAATALNDWGTLSDLDLTIIDNALIEHFFDDDDDPHAPDVDADLAARLRGKRDEVFQSFRREVANPALSETHRLLMLRTAATTHFWSAAQVRQLVSLIAYQQRVDAAVMLFKRTVDQQNFAEQVYRLLKPSERETLILRYQAELSFREIGEICGIEEATARKRASRGLQHLRKTLTHEGVE